ncbi:hypothetical protein HOF78_00995 [Candidatus Woesearchaeota archaeon]|jgi:hypothetical protein|nr:hypothetical protein [Candidatus Woesearchaeota archaeon]MBT6045037.1 hypothetical protein [Candidatus Woesearchaeota archaeon]
MDQERKLHVAFGIVVALILLLGVFTFGWVFGGSEESANTNQVLVVNSLRTVNQAQQPVQETTSKLGQSLTEQKRQNVESTNNNIEINIHNSGYYGRGYYNSNYYPTYNRYYSPYRTRYYNGYHPYYKHGFSYTNSYGSNYRYSYY